MASPVNGLTSVPVATLHLRVPGFTVMPERSRRSMSFRVSQPLWSVSAQRVPNSARAYPVLGARPLTLSRSNPSAAVAGGVRYVAAGVGLAGTLADGAWSGARVASALGVGAEVLEGELVRPGSAVGTESEGAAQDASMTASAAVAVTGLAMRVRNGLVTGTCTATPAVGKVAALYLARPTDCGSNSTPGRTQLRAAINLSTAADMVKLPCE